MSMSDEIDPLMLYMSDFLHLTTVRPEELFSAPPSRTIRESQERTIYDFFISYRHRECETYAGALAGQLGELGYRVFFAGVVPELSLFDDDQIRVRLQQALHSSSVLIIIGSEDALGGEWVEWEIETFESGHWGRTVPLISEDLGSPIHHINSSRANLLKQLRLHHNSAAIVYEEGAGAWQAQTPSATTIFCMILTREFFRVELDFWHRCSGIAPEARTRAFFQSLYGDLVCRTVMHAMHWPNRDYSLAQLKRRYLRQARAGGPTLWRKVLDGLSVMLIILDVPRLLFHLVRQIWRAGSNKRGPHPPPS